MPLNSCAKRWIPLVGILLLALALAPAAGAAGGLGALQADLRTQLALAGPHDGAYVYDVTAKKALFAERATTTRPPASVEKLYTATAALAQLGPAARLTTSIYGVGHLGPGGLWEGSLYLRGGGDPTFGSSAFIARHYGGVGASVASLVTQIVKTQGIHHVTGSINGDETFFDARRGEPSSNYGPDPFLEGTLSGVAFNRGATGAIHGGRATAAYAARALWGALKGGGVSIRGASGTGATPAGAVLLAQVQSPTVAQLLGLMLPPSDNFFAETLVKDLGALYGGAGTTAAGAAVIEKAISSVFAIHPRIVDGSGLSRGDRTSPYEVVDLLAGLAGTPTGQVLREHLAVVGHTGTLEKRMRRTAASGRCQGKTGTLAGASNLVGYCQAAGGHLLAFAIFNDAIATEAAHVFQDHMTITIANSRISSAEIARAKGA
ncbi:MAG: hypothetical protein QOK19_253 [Solirubrobacteraceae bacterium]|nr:hypothetical protein [Solirubrobacteraceae bacterium]